MRIGVFVAGRLRLLGRADRSSKYGVSTVLLARLIMASPAPNPKDLVYVLPSQVIVLGEALASVARGARQAMTRRVRSSGHEFVTIEDISHHMGVIQQALTHLSPRIDGLMTDVIHKEGAGAVEADRAAGRLEQVLSEFVDGYIDAKASHAGPESSEARSLILGVYRHHIRKICEWLEELVEVIANPASAIQKRGIAAAANVELTVALNMTSPPEMAKLDALAKKLLQSPEVCSDSSPRFEQREVAAPGLLGTIGALAFGIGITKAVLGRNHG
jgi:hypothetical protein